MAEKSTTLTYKGHPLRRKDNLIYYGSMADKYIVVIQVMGTEKDGSLEVANKAHLELQFTDPGPEKPGPGGEKRATCPTCFPPSTWVPSG